MKQIMLAIAILSLMSLNPVVGLGQGRAKARRAPAVGSGNQICTGCCDPCYSDDWWKIRNSQTASGATQARQAKPSDNARKRAARRVK